MDAQIIVKDENGLVKTLLNAMEESIDSYMDVRKKFGELRFSQYLGSDERLELILNGEVKMSHPIIEKKKKKNKKKKDVSSKENESQSPAKGSSDTKIKKVSETHEENLFIEADEEWEPEIDHSKEESIITDEKKIIQRKLATSARGWSAWNEEVVKPTDAEKLGDKFNQADEACSEIREISFVSVAEMAKKFEEQGLMVLDNNKFCLTLDQVTKLRKSVTTHYETKLKEAQREGLTSKKKSHRLAKGNEEAVPGFNQRPGGRIDMVLDDLDIDIQWPWFQVAEEILGNDVSLNYVGVVVARQGDSDQNWHIDGVHIDKTQHKSPDRIIVFCPLSDLNKDTGCTEMIPTSHLFRPDQSQFRTVSHLPRVRHYLPAGTPLAMDYRLWHRGLQNSANADRFLLYTVFERASRKRRLEDTARGNLAKFIRTSTSTT